MIGLITHWNNIKVFCWFATTFIAQIGTMNDSTYDYLILTCGDNMGIALPCWIHRS